MKSPVLAIIIFTLSLGAYADESPRTVKADFEGNHKVDYFSFDPSNIHAGIDYHSSTLNKIIHYPLDIQGECESVQIYQENGSKRVIIDGSCMGQGAQIHQYIYQWSSSVKNWCLREEITGQKADRTSGSDEETETSKVKGCVPFGKASD